VAGRRAYALQSPKLDDGGCELGFWCGSQRSPA